MGRLAGWGSAAVAVAMGVAGIAGLRSRRGAHTRPAVDDDEVARRVTAFLRARFGSKSEDFAIRVAGGRVALRGDLPTLREMVALGDDIRAIDGVVDVDNLLRLQVGSRPVHHGEAPDMDFWMR